MSDMNRSVDLVSTAHRLVNRHLAIQPHEQVLIVVDTASQLEMAYALAGQAQAVGAEWNITMMPARDVHNAIHMTKFINTGLEAVDVIIGLTRASGAPCYSVHVREGTFDKKRLRSMSMVFRTLDHFTKGGALADYDLIARNAKILHALWQGSKTIHVTTALGTDLTAPVHPKYVQIEDGFVTEPGRSGAFSDGEVFQHIIGDGATGTVVIDGPMYYFGEPAEPVRLTLEAGRVVDVQAKGRAANQLKEIIETVPDANNFAEIAIGLNPASLKNGDFEEEKKALGNIHVAVGKSPEVPCAVHMDLIMRNPSVSFDGKQVVSEGRHLYT